MQTDINIQMDTQSKMTVAALFAMISIVNVIISFMVAKFIFAGNTVIPYNVLLVVTFIGLELLLYLFVMPMANLVDSVDKKRRRRAIESLSTNIGNESQVVCGGPTVGATNATAVTTSPVNHHDIYVMSNEEAKNKEVQIMQKKKELVKIYVYEVMASLLEEEDIDFFWLEIEGWIDKSTYHPKGRAWKWKKDVKVMDARHLIWNIAKRLGMNKGYNIETCAAFIKMLFPDLCEEVKEATLMRTLKADPDKGYIKIDEPEDAHSFAFHNAA